MANISGFTPSQAYWFVSNWNQMRANILMNGLSNDGGEGFTLDTFKYTNDDCDETTQPYADVTCVSVENRHGVTQGNTFHYTSAYLLPSDVEEVVLCLDFSPGNFGKDSVMVVDDRYGLGFNYLWSYPVAWIKTVYRKTDGTISTLGLDGVHEMVLNYLPSGVNSGITNNGLDFMPRDANGYYWASRGEPNKSSKVSFKCSHKLFESQKDAEKYLKYGIDDSLDTEDEGGGGGEEEHPTATKTYTYDVQKFSYSDVAMSRPNGNVVHSVLNVTFTDFPTDVYDSITHYEPIVAVLDNDDYDSSVQFVIHSDFAQYITDCSIRIGNITVPITNPSTAITGLTSFGYGMGFDTTGSAYIKNMVHTNITIIGVGGSALPQTNILGGDVMITNTNNANFDVGLSECWVLSEHNVEKLAKCFNTTVNKLADNSGGYIVAEWLVGLASYNNPLDVVCDLFYLPVDISDYTDTDNGHFNFTPSLEALNEEE